MIKNHKIIFLDVDGVLNYEEQRQIELRSGRSIDFKNIRLCKRALRLIGKLCEETQAKVVIESSWRKHKTNGRYSNLRTQLRKIAGVEIFSETPISKEDDKEIEIEQWLKENSNIENYVIIDDNYMEKHKDRLVQCSSEKGFTQELYSQALDKLTRASA